MLSSDSRAPLALTCWASGALPVPSPPQPDAHHLSDEDRDHGEQEQQRVEGVGTNDCTVKECVRDDQSQQDVVQALQPLPGSSPPGNRMVGCSSQLGPPIACNASI